MTEKKEEKLREMLEERKAEMEALLDRGDRMEYVFVEGEIYELKKQLGESLNDW